MKQTDNDIFPEKEKKAAKRKKIAEMNAVTAQAILGSILNQLGTKYEQYHFRKYCVMIIPIGNGGIEIRLSDSNIIKQRKAIQEKLAKLFDFISGGASIEEVVTYCRYNSFTYIGYKARKYAVIDKTSQDHNDSSFESAFVPDGVSSIGDGAFEVCTSLKSIQLPEGVTSIGKGAFWFCKSLESIQLPEGVTSIGKDAFYDCKSLKSITLPDGLQSIGESAFLACESLKSITLPDGVRSIGDGAFCGCLSLKSIQLSAELKSIGEDAFYGCKSLKSIQLPNSLTSIGKKAFYACYGLISIIVDSNNPVYDSRDNCNAIIETATDTLIVGCQNTAIPAEVTSIGDRAFSNCLSLKSIKLPEGLQSIGEGAFGFCSSLESIQLPDGVKSIGEKAFFNCTSLENITFGGTKEQWRKIDKENGWYYKLPAKVIHCTDGEIEI